MTYYIWKGTSPKSWDSGGDKRAYTILWLKMIVLVYNIFESN